MVGALPTSLEPDLVVVFSTTRTPPGFAAAVADLGGEIRLTVPRLGFATVTGVSEEGAESLRKFRGVSHVHPDMILALPESPYAAVEAVMEDTGAGVDAANPAGAFFYPRQWHLRAIGAHEAWAAGVVGSSSVTVAILDTGLDYLYPDLVGRVDLDRSISYLALDDDWVAGVFPGRNAIADLHGHGTHVGSTVVSNGIVNAGVTAEVTLMGVKVCSLFGGCPGAAIFAGIDHAVANGADVINMSLGGWFDKAMYPGYVSVVQRAFNAARSAGVTIVVSAGNENLDLDADGSGFKTYCDAAAAMCVSATGPTSGGTVGPWVNVDNKASYSNYGVSAINVAAPGGAAGGAVWAACSKTRLAYDRDTGQVFWTVCSANPQNTYTLGMSGTSMAAPHVAGLAALMVGEYGRNPGRIMARIQSRADDLGEPEADPIYGKGRINVPATLGLN